MAIKCSVGDVEDATLEKFVEYVTSLPKWTTSGRLKETIGWGPENRSTSWFRFWAAAQNLAGGSSSVDIQVILTQENHMWLGYIYGQGSYNVKWINIV